MSCHLRMIKTAKWRIVWISNTWWSKSAWSRYITSLKFLIKLGATVGISWTNFRFEVRIATYPWRQPSFGGKKGIIEEDITILSASACVRFVQRFCGHMGDFLSKRIAVINKACRETRKTKESWRDFVSKGIFLPCHWLLAVEKRSRLCNPPVTQEFGQSFEKLQKIW